MHGSFEPQEKYPITGSVVVASARVDSSCTSAALARGRQARGRFGQPGITATIEHGGLLIEDDPALTRRIGAPIDQLDDIVGRKAVEPRDQVDVGINATESASFGQRPLAEKIGIVDASGGKHRNACQLPIEQRQLGVDAGDRPGQAARAIDPKRDALGQDNEQDAILQEVRATATLRSGLRSRNCTPRE